MGIKPETIFAKELKHSIMIYANEQGMPPPVILNMHGSVMMSGVPDMLAITSRGVFFAELKVRKTEPKRIYKLDAGVDPGQRTIMKAMALNNANVFLIVRMNRKMAIVCDITYNTFTTMKINPGPEASLPGGMFRMEKINGIWCGTGAILQDC